MASALFKKLLERVPKETEEEVHRSMTLAIRMHKLMRKQGISQIELSQMMNEREDKISHWLSGTYSFTTYDLVKVQTFFDKLSTLIPKKGNAEKITPKNRIPSKQQLATQKSYNNSSDDSELIHIPKKNYEIIITAAASNNSRTSVAKKKYEKL